MENLNNALVNAFLECLAAAGHGVEFYALRNMASLENFRSHAEVLYATAAVTAQLSPLYRSAGKFTDALHIAERGGCGDLRLKLANILGECFLILAVWVRDDNVKGLVCILANAFNCLFIRVDEAAFAAYINGNEGE